jgi:hypothetical protein
VEGSGGQAQGRDLERGERVRRGRVLVSDLVGVEIEAGGRWRGRREGSIRKYGGTVVDQRRVEGERSREGVTESDAAEAVDLAEPRDLGFEEERDESGLRAGRKQYAEDERPDHAAQS